MDLSRAEIPVPFLETRQKIVDILDRFDSLTASLIDGLPAEIEARNQQYEHYRDRLLDFPRKAIGTEWPDGTRAAAKGLPTFVTVPMATDGDVSEPPHLQATWFHNRAKKSEGSSRKTRSLLVSFGA